MSGALRFDQDLAQVKTSVADLSRSMGYVKAGLAAVAASAQLLKLDISIFKVDEKGFTILGMQKWT